MVLNERGEPEMTHWLRADFRRLFAALDVLLGSLPAGASGKEARGSPGALLPGSPFKMHSLAHLASYWKHLSGLVSRSTSVPALRLSA
jgi:hypothetical protein